LEQADDINRRLSKAARWIGIAYVLFILGGFAFIVISITIRLHRHILNDSGTDSAAIKQYFPHLTGIQSVSWRDETIPTGDFFRSMVRQLSGAVRLDEQGASELLREGEWETVNLDERDWQESTKHFLTPGQHQGLMYRGASRDLLKKGYRGRLYFEKRSRVLVFNISPISD